MNNSQVAKVVLAAQNALGETTNAAPQANWENLSDHDRNEKNSEIAAHLSGQRKGVDIDEVAKHVSPAERLKTYLTHGIVGAFHRHERALAGGNTLEHSASEDAQLRQTTSADTVNAQNALNRANAPEPPPADAKNIHEAMARADKSIADANKHEPAPSQPSEDSSNVHQ
jgi:hypothetical protein